MSRTLSLLSGKGGSGKTTLALSMASLLSGCGIKTLLIDCDLSTNGATYFYENLISNDSTKSLSFYRVLYSDLNNEMIPIKINETYDFIPSITHIENDDSKTYIYDMNVVNRFSSFYNQIMKDYDIVIFDCQAGYTELLRVVLQVSDINLVVMEADAISSAAIRSLYLKIGDLIGKKKVYQVFNKVTSDEYDVYSKISGGTVFTNIESIIFDWKIRKAFSVAQVPDMENSSAKFGLQVFNVCKILFSDPSLQEKLKGFEYKMKLYENKERKKEIEEKIDQIKIDKNSPMKKSMNFLIKIMSLITLLIIMLMFKLLVSKDNIFLYNDDNKLLIFTIFTFAVINVNFYINIWESSRGKRNYYKEIEFLRKEITELEKTRIEIEEKLS